MACCLLGLISGAFVSWNRIHGGCKNHSSGVEKTKYTGWQSFTSFPQAPRRCGDQLIAGFFQMADPVLLF